MLERRPLEKPDLEGETLRGAQAGSILSNPVLVEAFNRIETRYLNSWRGSAPVQTEQREMAWRVIHALDLLKAQLTSFVETGRLADVELGEQARREDGGSSPT